MAENIKIAKGQHLADVMDQIPSNVILNKQITGCGATTLEINAARNSIIIEPNVPVIVGKAQKHGNVFPVYEKVSYEEVEEYLRKPVQNRKIVTTPEGYDKKVRPALQMVIGDYRTKFFMLFDECEKIIQDVDYRGDIYLPVDDFFKFKHKAMVSATPIMPSDPRFAEQGFEMCKVEPTYDYRPRVKLVTTNNTIAALEQVIINKQKHICIFINSTDTIYRVIQTLCLEDRCKVFCSDKSVKKLRGLGFRKAFQELQELADINFFTSRFYSAVDIELPYKPYVVMLTDVIHAPFSSVDPATEVIQAVGRFRNGTEQIWHITNTDSKIKCITPESLKDRLIAHEQVYNTISTMPIENLGQKDAQHQALNGMEYKRFVAPTGNRNYFMWDNAFDDERIKSYYMSTTFISRAYTEAPIVVTEKSWTTTLSDTDRMRRESNTLTKPKRWQEVLKQARKIYEAKGDRATEEELIKDLGEQFRDMVHAIMVLGAREIIGLRFNDNAIAEAVTRTEHFNEVKAQLKDDAWNLFDVGMVEKVKIINELMSEMLKAHHIEPIGRVDRRYIELFFRVIDLKHNGDRCFRLMEKR